MTEKVTTRSLKKGEVLFFQGDEDRVLFNVLSGEIALYIDYKGKNERELARMKQDDCFGEMAILEHQPRTATAVAVEDCVLMAYPEGLMGQFISQNPRFALNIMMGLSAKLRNATSEIAAMQELLRKAKANPTDISVLDRYIRTHTEYDADGASSFVVRI